VEKIKYSRRKKRRECRSDANVANTQVEEREQHGYSLLLIPGKDKRERQVIDTAFEGFGQSQSDLQRGVSVVALADVEQAWKAANLSKVKLVEPELSASKRENEAIGGYGFG
jgi:hypothetical protein